MTQSQSRIKKLITPNEFTPWSVARIEYGVGGLVSTYQQGMSLMNGVNALPAFLPYWGLLHSVVNTLRSGYFAGVFWNDVPLRSIGILDMISNAQLGFMSGRDLLGVAPVNIGSGISNTVLGFAINSTLEFISEAVEMWAAHSNDEWGMSTADDDKKAAIRNKFLAKMMSFVGWTALAVGQAMGYGANFNAIAFAALAISSVYYLTKQIVSPVVDTCGDIKEAHDRAKKEAADDAAYQKKSRIGKFFAAPGRKLGKWWNSGGEKSQPDDPTAMSFYGM